MTHFDIARLACKVLGIYALLLFLQYAGYLLDLVVPIFDPQGYRDVDVLASVLWAAVPVLLLIAAWFLWRWADLVATRMIRGRAHEAPAGAMSRLTAMQVHAIVFSALGAWVLLDAVPKTAGYVVQIVRMPEQTPTDVMRVYRASTITDLAIRWVLGIWLLFGASGLVQLIHRLRRTGLE